VAPIISKLILHFGNQALTAKALGVSQPTVSYWLSGAQKISPEKAVLAEQKSGGAISASELSVVIAEVVALQTLNKSSLHPPDHAPGPDGSVHPSSTAIKLDPPEALAS
jgi:DNA-binding transcriptional regulator YdaS (Cro superfamily)